MRTTVAVLVALGISVAAAIGLAVVAGRLTPFISLASLLCGIGAAIYCLTIVRGAASPPQNPGVLGWLTILAFALFALRAFCWLIFVDGEDLSILSENNFSDLPLHLTFINYFARGATFWPDNPIYSGLKLHYPIGSDVFNALLQLIGVNEIAGLAGVGLVASLVTAIALFRWGKWFAIAAFLFNGGRDGFYFFGDLWDSVVQSLRTGHFAFRLIDYQAELAWKNVAIGMFMTQRGLLYGVPAGLTLLVSWRNRWLGRTALPLIIETFLFAALPLFSIHAFIWFSGLLGCWLLISPTSIRHHALRLLACSLVPATFFVALVTGLFSRSGSMAHIVHLQPGWMQDGDGFFEFWFENFGILPACAVALVLLTFWNIKVGRLPAPAQWWQVWKYRLSIGKRDWRNVETQTTAAFVIPALAIFLVACFVMFAPYEWDNAKIMIWSYFAILPFLWRSVIRPWPRLVRFSVCVLLFFSGFISLCGGLDFSHTGYPIVSRQELHDIREAVRNLSVNDTFAAYPAFNHPLLLSGCKLVEGFEGHLDSHGIDYRPRLQQLNALMSGQSDWHRIAADLHVHYLFWGSREQEHYAASSTPWRDQCSVVAHGEWGTIYDLR